MTEAEFRTGLGQRSIKIRLEDDQVVFIYGTVEVAYPIPATNGDRAKLFKLVTGILRPED